MITSMVWLLSYLYLVRRGVQFNGQPRSGAKLLMTMPKQPKRQTSQVKINIPSPVIAVLAITMYAILVISIINTLAPDPAPTTHTPTLAERQADSEAIQGTPESSTQDGTQQCRPNHSIGRTN